MTDRQKVIKLLEKVEKGGYSTILLNNALTDEVSIKSAFITRAFYGVIERKITLDYIIFKYSENSTKKPPLYVLCALRLCLYECLFMDNSQTFAAVNEAVDIIKKSKYGYLSGYANALLRNAVNYELKNIENKSPDIKYSVNPVIFDTVSKAVGEINARNFFENSLKQSEVFVMPNTVKCDINKLLFDCELEKTPLQNIYIAKNFSPNEPHFVNGDYFVIDSSAAYTIFLLEPTADDTVLDLCSSPGGKTFCAAILSNNKAKITALDLYEHRVNLVKSNAKKLGLSVTCHTNDATVYNQKLGEFSLVICDVPCSGIGVIKRKPEIKYKELRDFNKLPQIQSKILQTSAKYLKKGGRMLYSTCTLNVAENENVVADFLNKNKDFKLLKQQYILPSQTGGDGFFAAIITRK